MSTPGEIAAARPARRPPRRDPGPAARNLVAASLQRLAGLVRRRRHPALAKVERTAQMLLPDVSRSERRVVTSAASVMLRGHIADVPDPDNRADALIVAAAALAESGGRVHVISLSDAKSNVLAKRAEPLLGGLGLSYAAIPDDADHDARQQAFRSAVVFASATRIAQDRLRDQIAVGAERSVARRHVQRLSARGDRPLPLLPTETDALVDDADLLMLEAIRDVRLAESEDPHSGRMHADQAFAVLSTLEWDSHYSIDSTTLRIRLTPAGKERLETFAILFGGAWTDPAWREETIHAAIAIRDLYKRNADYRIENGAIILCRASAGHSAEPSISDLIAAKEGVRSGIGTAHFSDTRQIFRAYPFVGGAGAFLGGLRDEFMASYGKRVRGSRPLPTPLEPRVFRTRSDLLAAAARLDLDPLTDWLWAPTPQDASDIPVSPGHCRVLVGEEIFAQVTRPRVLVQLGAAQGTWEGRLVTGFLAATALVSAEDGLWRVVEDDDPKLKRFTEDPTAESYREVQLVAAVMMRRRRLAHIRSMKYFEKVMSFVGGQP